MLDNTSCRIIRNDLRTVLPIVIIGTVLGCIVCVFINNIAISSLSMNPILGATLSQVYFTATGILPTIIVGVGCSFMLFVLPRLREEDDYNKGTIKSHILTLAIAPLIVEVVILSAHLLTIWFKTGSFEGYSYIPVAYLGMYFLALFFASLVVFGAGVFRKAALGLGFAGIVSIWCLISAMVAVMSCPLFIQMGAGDESLSSFYNVTITGLVDYPSLVSLSTPLPDYSCLLGLFAIFIIAIALLLIGAYLMARRTSS